jgi:hypothetical protein
VEGLQVLRRQVRGEFLAESRKHKAVKVLSQIPASVRFGPRCCWPRCKRRTDSGASGHCGAIVAWE